MALTANDIKEQLFSKTFRGYCAQEVHAFLEKVAEAYQNMKDHLTEVENELTLVKSELSHAVLNAQQTLSEHEESAKIKAENILHTAQLQAERLIQESQTQLQKQQTQIQQLSRQRQQYIEEMRATIQTHARLLDLHENRPDFCFQHIDPKMNLSALQLCPEDEGHFE
jgi:cell division initiation protein